MRNHVVCSDPTITAKLCYGFSRTPDRKPRAEGLDADRTDALEAPLLRAAPEPVLASALSVVPSTAFMDRLD
jgi:hypothetical protein